MSLVVFGSANADLTLVVRDIPAAGETSIGTSFHIGVGGKGLNQAVAAARLGAPTVFVGRVGDDEHGRLLTDGLVDAGVDTTGLGWDPQAASGVALVMVDQAGENRIVIIPGANGHVGAAEVALVGARLDSASVLLLQLELPMAAVVGAVGVAGDRGATVILDPAPAPATGLPVALYRRHVILTPNESEAAALVGHPVDSVEAVESAARELLRRGAGAVVLKLGERGLCWAQPGLLGWQATLRVPVVDTVGAGDAVNGALGMALSQGATMVDAVRWAVVAGSLAVTRAGAGAAMPTRREVMDRLGDLDRGGAHMVGGTGPTPATVGSE